METTINLPAADQVLELIREFRAARDAGRHALPVAQREPPKRDALWPPLLLAIGLLSAGALATDLLYPFVSGPTAFSKPTFAVFSSVALAGRLAGARGAWCAVLFAWPAEVLLLGRTNVDLHELVHLSGTLLAAAVVAACFTPWVWWPGAPWAALPRAWDRAVHSFGLLRLRRWRLFLGPGEQPAAGLFEYP